MPFKFCAEIVLKQTETEFKAREIHAFCVRFCVMFTHHVSWTVIRILNKVKGDGEDIVSCSLSDVKSTSHRLTATAP